MLLAFIFSVPHGHGDATATATFYEDKKMSKIFLMSGGSEPKSQQGTAVQVMEQMQRHPLETKQHGDNAEVANGVNPRKEEFIMNSSKSKQAQSSATVNEGSCEHSATVEQGVSLIEQGRNETGVTLESAPKSANQPILDGTADPQRSIWSAARSGDWEAVKEGIQRDPMQITVTGIVSFAGINGLVCDLPLLHLAVCNRGNSSTSILEFLIAHGADVNSRDGNGWQPIHHAIWCADIAALEFLITNGADIHSRINDGMTALHIAAWRNPNVAITEYLVGQGADIHARDNNGYTPLHCASYSNPVVAVSEYLVGQGADIHACDNDGCTPLHLAAHSNTNVAVVEYLLSVGADIGAKTNYGATPLHLAAYGNSNVAVLEHFLSVGADIEAKTNDGKTSLHAVIASDVPNLAVLLRLLQRGADINAKDADGETPLHSSVARYVSNDGHGNHAVQICLLTNGADTRLLDNKGRKPSDHIDIRRLVANWEFCVLWLLHVPELVNVRSGSGLTLLHYCARNNDVAAASFILERGINVNVPDDCGRTPLHFAAKFCTYAPIVQFLISHGADVSIKDRQGRTPFDLSDTIEFPTDEFTKSLLKDGISVSTKVKQLGDVSMEDCAE